ncbi:MAG: FAD-dependent oxidoreductase [Clostridia bacterium]|nr:FAD-dependent oxidoreductase [Clostridia bacterium]
MFISEKEKRTPVTSEYDTVVVGGGIAGVSAALAAARNGAKTLLIEREYMLGGLATAGLIIIYLPICDGKGKQVCFGIAEELIKLSVADGSEYPYKAEDWINGEEIKKNRFLTYYNPNVFAIRLEQLLIENGVDILYGTCVCDTICENGFVTHLITENKSGREAIALKTVVDCTGDADICLLAGEDTALSERNGNILAAWCVEALDGKTILRPIGACDSQQEEDELQIVKVTKSISGVNAKEISERTILSHKLMLDEFLKNGPVSESHSLATMPSIPQLRMTRRLVGIYTQGEDEMHKEFADSVGLYPDWKKCGPIYELPYSCLKGNKIKNLLAAGRCISADDELWDITRVIPVCAVSGEAAGTAAAMGRNLDEIDISALQERLRAQNVKIHEKEL